MQWIVVFICIAALATIVLLRRADLIGVKTAREYLENHALLIDVRTPAEFDAVHLSNAVNMPLSGIEVLLPARIHDKNRVLLLHCESGLRSAIAKRKLKALGYPNAFNLGSYARAERIVAAK